jgi:hypothetical protein
MARYEERNGLLVPSRRIESPELVLKVNNLRGFWRKRPAAAASISFVDSLYTNSASPTAPTHATGDWMVVGVFGGSATIPSLASGFTDIGSRTQNSAIAFRAGYKVCASAAESAGTWTNGNRSVVIVYRSVASVGTPGQSGSNGSTTATFAAITVTATSWGVAFICSASGGTIPPTPSGMTSRGSGGTVGNGSIRAADTNGQIGGTSFDPANVTVSNTQWITFHFELRV